ncbi:NAD(P)-dependent oxidoreductase [Pigmentiphaga soli]|uniref:NAD(P)-dependent oxidoreductase n=1 Tax=Pigmentiphaga soli TaxID=1007095 RepID=A0ABP8HQK4_9BURK
MTVQANPEQLGFIGVGVMGEPMCRHLATKTGLPVLVSDTNPEPVRRLAAEGAIEAAPDRLGAEADVIFLSLPSREALEAVLFGERGLYRHLKAGQTVVDLSTTPYAYTLDMARRLQELGIVFADAPVMRTRAAAQAGKLSVPVGASAEAYARIRPLIATFASDIVHAGGIGAGQVAKLLNNMVLYETVLALGEAYAIGRKVGVDTQRLFDILSTGSADSFALRNHGMKAIVPQAFPEKAFPVTYARKDILYALELAEHAGVRASGARNLLETFDAAIEQGYGGEYAPAISKLFLEG